MILFLLSFPAAIAVWVWLAKKLKAQGKGAVRHLAGAAAGFATWLAVCIVGTVVDGKPTDNQMETVEQAVTASETVTASEPQKTENQKEETKAETRKEVVHTLDLDWETFRRRTNEDLTAIKFSTTIPSSIQPKGGEGAVRDVAMLPFNDNLNAIISVDPESKKLTGISVMVSGSEDGVDNIRNFSAAAMLMAAADGDNGNKTVGVKLIKMISGALEKFNKGKKNEVKDSFVQNGVKYGILISKVMPAVMMYAEPEHAADKQ